jgi:hypothetical protein
MQMVKECKGSMAIAVAIATFGTAMLVTTVAQAVPGECVPVPPGLVSWYRGENNTQDALGNNHGTLQNGASYDFGVVGQGFLLDGSDDHVLVPDAASLDVTGDLTIDAWVLPIAYGDQRVIVSKRSFDNQNANMVFFMDTDGRLQFVSRDGGGPFEIATSTSAVPLFQWTLVAVTISGSTLTFYQNGVADGTTVLTGTRPANTGDMTIGIVSVDPTLIPPLGYAAAWAGLLDEVEIFSTAVTPQFMQDLYDAGAAGKCLGSIGVEPRTWGDTKRLYRD